MRAFLAVAGVLAVAAVLAYIAYRIERHREQQDDDTSRLDDVLPTVAESPAEPVVHEGATEEWKPRREFAALLPGDPFTADLNGIDLDGAPEYAAMVRRTGLDIGWMPESFTGWWLGFDIDGEAVPA